MKKSLPSASGIDRCILRRLFSFPPVLPARAAGASAAKPEKPGQRVPPSETVKVETGSVLSRRSEGIRFQVTGKNAASTGSTMYIDSSGWPWSKGG